MWLPRRSRPSPRKEAWMPKSDRGPDPHAEVPEHLRKVKLSKKRARYDDGQGTRVVLVILLFLAGTVVLLYGWWSKYGTWSYR